MVNHPEHHSDSFDYRTTEPISRPQEVQERPSSTKEPRPLAEQQLKAEHPEGAMQAAPEPKRRETPYLIRQVLRRPRDQVMTDDTKKSPVQIEIENIMSEGLESTYYAMAPAQQERFRKRGEEVAKIIDGLIIGLKLTARRVLHLIRSWLKLIPGINKYFLEQEAKLKTDAIMEYGREEMLKRRSK